MSELKFYLKWSYNEPKHPTKTMSEYTWETGIEYTIDGAKLKFDENTTFGQFKESSNVGFNVKYIFENY